MRVFVIGAGGYIGERLVSQLQLEGFDVVAADVRPSATIDEIVDMRSAADLYRALLRHRPDIVVITAYMLTRQSAVNPVRAVETNVLGLTNVFQAAADMGLRRVIFTAAGAIYGQPSDFPNRSVDETVSCRPRTLYARMKLFDEWMAEHFNSRGDTEVVSFRLSGPRGVFGPLGRTSNAGGASVGGSGPYELVIDAALQDHKRILFPWGRTESFRFIQVEDAAKAFIPLISTPELTHRIYNSPGFAVPIASLAAAAEDLFQIQVEWEEPARPIDHIAHIDSSRYESEFSFRPRTLSTSLRDEADYALTDVRPQ